MNKSQLLRFGLLAFAGMCLTACVNHSNKHIRPASQVENFQSYLHDEVFLGAAQLPAVEKIALLELDQATKNYLDRFVVGLETEQERYQALRQWVFERYSNYEYDITETLSITNLANSRKINCLSFSNLFVAAARYVDIPADFQLVYAPPYWDGNTDTWVLNQHVNVYGDIKVTETTAMLFEDLQMLPNSAEVLYFREVNVPRKKRSRQRYVADINRAVVSVPFKARPLTEKQILALFYNNKAGVAIQAGESLVAYAYLKAALEVDTSLASVWNNLGVLYQRANRLDLAEQVYVAAMDLDDDTYSVQSNLASVYRLQGKSQLALPLEQAVEGYRKANPYYHFSLGEKSLANDDFQAASQHFSKAIELKHNEQLFYYALAKVQVRLSQYELVAENLKNARIYAKGGEKARYSNKLQMFEEAVAVYQATQ